jgi:hypothetical protein
MQTDGKKAHDTRGIVPYGYTLIVNLEPTASGYILVLKKASLVNVRCSTTLGPAILGMLDQHCKPKSEDAVLHFKRTKAKSCIIRRADTA